MISLTRLLILLVMGLLLGGLLSGTALPAAADPLDGICKEVPAPVRPDFQTAGLVMDKPDLAAVPDAAPDPFKDAQVPISDVYGWAWRYTNYDLGCGSDFIRDPHAVAATNIANIEMAWLATMTSAVNSVENMSRTASFDFLKPVVARIAGTLDQRVLTVWLPLALLLVSVIVGFGAVRAPYSESFRRLLVVVVCVGLAVVALVFPVKATNLMDDGATAVSQAAQAGFSPRASDLITRESLYKTWLVGYFGSADSPTAVEYGPRLMSALTYTWSDVKRIDADPGAQKAIDKAKATEFKTIAAEVEKKDPAAYESFTGKTDTRTAGTMLGAVWVLIMGLFVVLASLITVVARLIMIALVVAAMVVSVVGVVRYSALQRMWDLFTAAIVNTVKFTIAAGVMTLILGAIQHAPIGMGWRLLLAIVVTVIAIMITKPVTSFKSMAGLDPSRHYLGPLLRRIGGTALGVVAGQKINERQDQHDRGVPMAPGEATPSPTYTVQPVEPSMPPLPVPMILPARTAIPVRTAATAPVARLAGDGSRQAAISAGVVVEPARTLPAESPPNPNALPAETVRPDDAPRMRPLTVLPRVAGIVTARPVVVETAQLPASRTRGGAAELTGHPDERHLVLDSAPVTVAGALPGSPRVNGVKKPLAAETAVTYPTGIVVQHEPNLYRPGGSLRIEEYLWFPEPQLDANGEETSAPLYHAKAAA